MTYHGLFFLFLSYFFNSVLANEKQECKACVTEGGCTYCRSDNFFENPSVCACDLGRGFFGSCDDYSFGSKPLDSKLDCAFNTPLSWLVLIAIIVGAGIFFCSIYCCCIKSGRRRSSNGAGIPEPIISNATATATNTTPFQNRYASAITYQPEPGTSDVVPFATAVPYTTAKVPPAYNPSYAAAELDSNVEEGDLNSSYP
jgi:hypothetical protein